MDKNLPQIISVFDRVTRRAGLANDAYEAFWNRFGDFDEFIQKNTFSDFFDPPEHNRIEIQAKILNSELTFIRFEGERHVWKLRAAFKGNHIFVKTRSTLLDSLKGDDRPVILSESNEGEKLSYPSFRNMNQTVIVDQDSTGKTRSTTLVIPLADYWDGLETLGRQIQEFEHDRKRLLSPSQASLIDIAPLRVAAYDHIQRRFWGLSNPKTLEKEQDPSGNRITIRRCYDDVPFWDLDIRLERHDLVMTTNLHPRLGFRFSLDDNDLTGKIDRVFNIVEIMEKKSAAENTVKKYVPLDSHRKDDIAPGLS